MEKNLKLPGSCPLFAGISAGELFALLDCLGARSKTYAKGEYILHGGGAAAALGIVCCGAADVLSEDCWGRRGLHVRLQPGQVFAEAYACAGARVLGVSVQAALPCTVLLLDADRILQPCSNGCAAHRLLLRNLVAVLAEKSLTMNEKLAHITQRTTREKLLSYLSVQAQRSGSLSFEIPFNRQQLADYLSVERSAMCSELGRMRDEGLLRFERSRFVLADGFGGSGY